MIWLPPGPGSAPEPPRGRGADAELLAAVGGSAPTSPMPGGQTRPSGSPSAASARPTRHARAAAELLGRQRAVLRQAVFAAQLAGYLGSNAVDYLITVAESQLK